MLTSAPHAPARPTPASVHGSRSDHSIVSKSHADSHNPHLQIQYPPASLQDEWLLPVLRRTPAGARDDTSRMSRYSRKFLRKSLPYCPIHARTVGILPSWLLAPAQITR